MIREEIKDIEGFEGLYGVTSTGKVISIYYRQGLELTQVPDKDGYLQLGLYKNKISHTKKVHRLVAQAFIPNPENKPTVNHRDLDKTNNNVTNLEWSTNKEQTDHCIAAGGRNDVGGNNPMSKMTDSDALEVVRLLEETAMTQKEISEMFGVKRKAINEIARGANWKHITGGNKVERKFKNSLRTSK